MGLVLVVVRSVEVEGLGVGDSAVCQLWHRPAGGMRLATLSLTVLNQTPGDVLHSDSVENTCVTPSPEGSGRRSKLAIVGAGTFVAAR